MVNAVPNQETDLLANEMFSSLTSGVQTPDAVDFTDPKYSFNVDENNPLYATIQDITLDDLTCEDLDGEGVFDRLMKAMDVHLKEQFQSGRLTGDQYAKVYTSALQGVLQNATTFLLQRDQSKWQGVIAQMQARVAEIEATSQLIELEKTKAETAKMSFEMLNSGAQYALTKLKLSTEDATYDGIIADVNQKNYTTRYLLPAELAVTDYQRRAVLPADVAVKQVQADRILPAEAAIKEYSHRVLMPLEADISRLQRDEVLPAQYGQERYKLDNLLPVQLAQEQHMLNNRIPAETALVQEQVETQRANTLDTRSDGITPVSGSVGLQNATAQYSLTNLLPIQKQQEEHIRDERQPAETELVKEQVETQRANTLDTRTDGTTAIAGVVGKQKLNVQADTDTKAYQLSNVLPAQVSLTNQQTQLTQGQRDLVDEQRESERAKTMDTRTDGTTVVEGSVGKQKDLYDEQIASFKKDAQHKTAKMYLDAWITQKTLDEGLIAPVELQNAAINAVISEVRTVNDL